jgi:hypothetical protein
MYLKVTDHENLVRDTHSRALLNTDRTELEAYYAERDIKLKELQEKQALESKVNKLEQDMSDIKNLLQQLVTRT